MMSFELKIRTPTGISSTVTVDASRPLFVLGANGAGKSSLMHEIYKQHTSNAKWVSAHRRSWLESNAPTLSEGYAINWRNNLRNGDLKPEARWSDHVEGKRVSIALSDLLGAVADRTTAIATLVDSGDLEQARMVAEKILGQSQPSMNCCTTRT